MCQCMIYKFVLFACVVQEMDCFHPEVPGQKDLLLCRALHHASSGLFIDQSHFGLGSCQPVRAEVLNIHEWLHYLLSLLVETELHYVFF